MFEFKFGIATFSIIGVIIYNNKHGLFAVSESLAHK